MPGPTPRVVVGAVAIFALVEKNVIPIDYASCLMILLSAWMIAHLYDASYWYNRNLVIIANIERQFLTSSDLKEIQYYFGKHREKSAMLTHLKIQYALGVTIAVLFVIYHFTLRVLPGIHESPRNFEFTRSLPYLIAAGAIIFLLLLRRNRIAGYEEFCRNSPGIEVHTRGINYGVGHPIDQSPIQPESAVSPKQQSSPTK